MGTIIGIKEIRSVGNGYIVEARYPYGPDPAGYGEVICPTIKEVHELIDKVFDCVENPS